MYFNVTIFKGYKSVGILRQYFCGDHHFLQLELLKVSPSLKNYKVVEIK